MIAVYRGGREGGVVIWMVVGGRQMPASQQRYGYESLL